MRLFVAVEMPPVAVEELKLIQIKLKTPEAALRFVKDFHLTLRFIGEALPETTEKIKAALAKVRFSAIKAVLGSIGTFPASGLPRVIYAALEPSAVFRQLHDDIDRVLNPLLPKDERFESHVTLARVKGVQNRKVFLDKLKMLKPKPIEFPADRFHIIQSTLTREGPVYEHIAEYKAL